MDLNKQIADMMKKLGASSNAVDEIMQSQPEFDFSALAAEAEAQGGLDPAENPALAEIMKNMSSFADQIAAQGGLMPDDMEQMAAQFGGFDGFGFPGGTEGMDDVLAKVNELLGTGYEELDLDEEVALYDPAAEDAADRKFVAVLKEWIKASAAEIPEQDVCAFEIGYHVAFEDASLEKPVYEIWISYNTEKTRAANIERFGENVWNWINWTQETFRTFDDAPFAAWRESQGYDEENDGDEMTERVYDLAVVAVMELHREKFTEQRFGHKVPFIIEDFEYYQKTAIRAVKANGGKALFDKDFFAECGFSDDDEEA